MTADERLLPLAPDLAAAPVFAIRKSWVDTEAGIGMVQIQYAWTPSGEQPDWEAAEETILHPHPDLPGLRSAVLEVPRFVNGSATYALHHFFFVIRGTDRITSPIFTEDIVAREIILRRPGRGLHLGGGGVAGRPGLVRPLRSQLHRGDDGWPFLRNPRRGCTSRTSGHL